MNTNANLLDRAARNTIVILMARMIEIGSGFLIMFILCRYLKPALFGDYAFVSAIILAFQPLVNLEMNTILIREISKDRSRQNELLGGAILLKAVLMTLLIGAAIALDLYMGLTPLLRVADHLALFSELFQQVSWIFSTPFMAKERMEFEMLSVFLFRIVHLTGIGLLPILTLTTNDLRIGFIGVFLVTLIAHVVKTVLNWRMSTAHFQMERLPFKWGIARELLDQMWIMGLATFCTGLSLRVDVYFLKAFHSSSEISMFHVPHMIVLQMQILAVALVTATYPVLSRLGADRLLVEQFRTTRDMTFRILSIAGMAIGAAVAGFAPMLIRFIAGSSFEGSIQSLRILSVCVPILFLNYLGANLLTALKHQHLLIYGAVASLVTNIILDYLWVPAHGAVGASWATGPSYALQLVILGYLFNRIDPTSLNLIRILLGPATISLLMATAMILTPESGMISWLIDGSIALVGGVILIRMLPDDMLKLLRRFRLGLGFRRIDNTRRSD